MAEDDCLRFQIGILGDAGVGKRHIILQYADFVYIDSFVPHLGPKSKLEEVRGKKISLQLLDPQAIEEQNCRSSLGKRVHGLILVFDLTTRSSFDHLGAWVEKARENAYPKAPLVIVGNKLDLAYKRVPAEESEFFCSQHNAHYFETSAKDHESVCRPFLKIVDQLLNARDKTPEEPKYEILILNQPTPIRQPDQCTACILL